MCDELESETKTKWKDFEVVSRELTTHSQWNVIIYRNMHENSIITLRGDSNGRVSIWKLAPQQDQQIDWMLQFSEEIPVGKPTGLNLR